MILSFGGSGYSFPFYVGVYKALIEIFGYDELSTFQIAGSSSGSIIALCICAGISYDSIVSHLNTTMNVNTYFGPGYGHVCLLYWLSGMPDLHNTIGTRLCIPIMGFFKQIMHKTSFEDHNDLCRTILISCSIPFFSFFRSYQIDPCFFQHIDPCDYNEDEIVYISVLDDVDISLYDIVTFYDIAGFTSKNRVDELIEIGYVRTKDFFQTRRHSTKQRIKKPSYVIIKPLIGWCGCILHTLFLFLWYTIYAGMLSCMNFCLIHARKPILWFLK